MLSRFSRLGAGAATVSARSAITAAVAHRPAAATSLLRPTGLGWRASPVAPAARVAAFSSTRGSDSSAPFDLAGALEKVSSHFGSARMDIEDAVESVGTTYYPADISLAQKAVQDTLDAFVAVQQSLLALDREDEAQRIRESWSLRLEQLKAELDAAIEAGGADH